MPQVTVILPTWNRAKWLKKSVESVLSQTFQDFELIVVDDASTDSTEEVLESYSGKIRTIFLPETLALVLLGIRPLCKATVSGSHFWTQMIFGIPKS